MLVLVQSAVLVHVRIWGVHPFILPAIAVIPATLERGEQGLLYGAFFGLCLLYTSSNFGRTQGTPSPTVVMRQVRLSFRRGRCPHRPAGASTRLAAGHMGPALQRIAVGRT